MARTGSTKNSLLKFRKNSLILSTDSTNRSPSTSNQNGVTNERLNNKTPSKKYLRHTGFNQMINEMAISTCQKYMEINARKRFIYYTILVVIGGILCDATPVLVQAFLPFKTEKKSILNQYFVKLGWLWTLIFLIPFQILIRRSIENSNKWYNFKDLTRVVIVTLIWYLSVNTFNFIEVSTGKCSKLSIRTRRECLSGGWKWIGFDISGHTFLLLFANLILFEESKAINGFENFGYLLDARNQELIASTNQACDHHQKYNKLLIPSRIVYISMTILAFLWDFMLFQTVLNYHSFAQKLIAYIWALACWYFCYQLVFPLDFLPNLMPLKIPNKLQINTMSSAIYD